MSSVILGYETSNVSDINSALSFAANSKIEFLAIPLFHPRFRRDNRGISDSREGPISRSDLVLPSKDWISNIVGKISPVIVEFVSFFFSSYFFDVVD
jgi:protein arginine N-methyltransferase 5